MGKKALMNITPPPPKKKKKKEFIFVIREYSRFSFSAGFYVVLPAYSFFESIFTFLRSTGIQSECLPGCLSGCLLRPCFTFWVSLTIGSVATGNQWSGPTKSVLKWFHWSAPLVSRGNWSDRTTESESESGPLVWMHVFLVVSLSDWVSVFLSVLSGVCLSRLLSLKTVCLSFCLTISPSGCLSF